MNRPISSIIQINRLKHLHVRADSYSYVSQFYLYMDKNIVLKYIKEESQE